MDNERKDKIKRVLKRVYVAITSVISVIFIICVVVACSQGNKKQNNNVQVACAESEVIDIQYDNKKFISYDDESYNIEFTLDEVNNYVWNNLSALSGEYLTGSKIIYNSSNYLRDNAGSWTYLTSDTISINTSKKFQISSGGVVGEFNQGFILRTTSEYYEIVKGAVQSDYEANNPNINDGIFETLTTSVVSFVGSLNSGIQEMTSVFYDSTSNNLTTIGLLSVIVVAVSLCYWLFRLIIGLIRMRG